MGIVKSGIISAVTVAVAALTLLLHSSCSTTVCADNRNTMPEAGFYDIDTGAAVSVVGLTVGGIDAPNDSLLYDNATTQLVYLPLRAAAEVTSFRFHFTGDDYTDPETGETVTVTDYDNIVTFYYSATPYFDGQECGAIEHFYLDRVDFTPGGHIVDIQIVDPNVTNEAKEYVHIFFRTTSDTDDDTSDDNTGDDDSEAAAAGDDTEAAAARSVVAYDATKGGRR